MFSRITRFNKFQINQASRLLISNATTIESGRVTKLKSLSVKNIKPENVSFVSQEILSKYPWISEVPEKELSEGINLIKLLDIQDINDFIPLLRAPSNRTLTSLLKSSPDEVTRRVYAVSLKLDVAPSVVAYYFASRLFMFKIDFNHVIDILNILLEYKIAPRNILKGNYLINF